MVRFLLHKISEQVKQSRLRKMHVVMLRLSRITSTNTLVNVSCLVESPKCMNFSTFYAVFKLSIAVLEHNTLSLKTTIVLSQFDIYMVTESWIMCLLRQLED